MPTLPVPSDSFFRMALAGPISEGDAALVVVTHHGGGRSHTYPAQMIRVTGSNPQALAIWCAQAVQRYLLDGSSPQLARWLQSFHGMVELRDPNG